MQKSHKEGEYSLNPESFYDAEYTVTLEKLIQDIVNFEAPIREDVLAHRVARAHDFKKTDRMIFGVVSRIVKRKHKLVSDEGHNFVWSDGIAPADCNLARLPANEGSKKQVDEISTVELRAFAIAY